MNIFNDKKTIIAFNELAYQFRFVYSLFGESLKQAKNGNLPFDDIETIITYNTLIKLKESGLPLNLNLNEKNIFIPQIKINNEYIYLNILIQSNNIKANSKNSIKLLKKINDGNFCILPKLFDYIYDKNPDTWVFVYYDFLDKKTKLYTISNININYYKTIKIDNLELPYINIEKSI
ncbi:hypothetical protein ACXYRP_01970 [Mycoplasma sp. 5912]